MSLPWYISFIKMIFICISNYYAIDKIMNTKVKEKILEKLILCIFWGLIYSIMRKETGVLLAYLIYYLAFSIIYSIFFNISMMRGIVISSIANTITIICIFLASILNFLLMKILQMDLNKYNILEYIIIGVIQTELTVSFFRIKRFKNGLQFLHNRDYNAKINIIGIAISSMTIISFTVYGFCNNYSLKTFLLICLFFGGILMLYWIKKSITKYYKEKMKERTVEIQQEQIKQQDEKIKNLQTELADVLQINHKYSHRISAMEKAVTKLGTKLQANEEFAEEYGDILSSIKKLSKEYKEEVASAIKETKLPKTNIFSIDNLLEYMKQESEKDKIDFELNLDFDISEILETKIPQSKLETMLADHIRDAIIAINCSENKDRRIKVVLDKEDNNYQIKFYDTGIEFEIETLSNLGLKRITTHKSAGGSGIGFMTTFETLKQCKASLIIEEYSDLEYTKAVIIKFDNKNEYRIHSYRAEEIKNKIKDNRIIIE